MPGLRSLTYFYTHQSSFLRELIRPWPLQYNQLSGCVCCMTAVMTACLCQGVYVAIRVNSMCIVSACGCLQYCGVYSRLWMCKYKECVCVCVSTVPFFSSEIQSYFTPLYPGFDRTSSISVTMSSCDIMFLFSVFNIGASKNWQAS